MIRRVFFFVVNKLIPKRFLFYKKTSTDIYFAYVDPQQIKTTSFIRDGSRLIVGSNANTGEFTGMWGDLHYSFDQTLVFQLAKEFLKKNFTAGVFKFVRWKQSQEKVNFEIEKFKNLNAQLRTKYSSQYELQNLGRTLQFGKYILPRNEIYIGINKKGEYIRLFSGGHRLALAQLKNLKEIPVIISLYHPKGKQFFPKKNRLITGKEEDYKPF